MYNVNIKGKYQKCGLITKQRKSEKLLVIINGLIDGTLLFVGTRLPAIWAVPNSIWYG